MLRTAYLRVYQPIHVFAPSERAAWQNQPAPARADEAAVRRWLLSGSLDGVQSSPGGAFLRRVGGVVLVCPWRTRLRMLAGLLAFRDAVPEEVADAFVPHAAARAAARELARLDGSVRSHIIHSNWHVPLRWFVAFDETERVLVEDARGLRLRYETSLGAARARLEHAVEVLEELWVDDRIADMVRDLAEWLDGFPGEGLLELDYGGVARSFVDEELAADRTAGEVWDCLKALEDGDLVRAGHLFNQVSERWARARVLEAVN